MRLTLTLAVAAIGSLLFGLAYVLVPASLLSQYGITLDPSNQWVARYFGAALLGFAAILWLARKVASGPALRAILVGAFVASTTGLVLAILELAYGSGSTLVWSTALIYFLLSLGFGDFVFRTPPPR
jgi:phosphoglycerol transferase MdoB-like AlkP superfamily enzyme